ncbi:MAG: S-adenosylmethionine:tRNA ribosyltransferase-isomerase [Gammaproteobacteria bacterium]|nr:MAG: S-adenosylmethionine:tRNA ribosyltransferase-isomerase [Gammaproteobacteria bacterium]TND07360.1 MAG: S-adenosylmethionine:tRNA ribosyltransferase-isomerase [Gammaproteobacteria bacterium]
MHMAANVLTQHPVDPDAACALRRDDFRFELPAELIAQQPLPSRTASRLLCLDGDSGAVADCMFSDILQRVWPGDLLVLNDTRVIPARLHGHKATGGAIEVLVERVVDDTTVLAHVRASHAPLPGSRLHLADTVVTVVRRRGDLFELSCAGIDGSISALLERAGKVPLPPYIQREALPEDRERYQTVYARQPGAVAAPTAGLHFDDAMLETLRQAGVETAFVTLHVGAGTFQPVRAERLAEHRMHAERAVVTAEVCETVGRVRARGGRVIAVGTTSVRGLEAAFRCGKMQPFSGETNLFIYPGYRFGVVDAMITNFHVSESTLLMLVCAFAGRKNTLHAYRHAVAAGYRFFSYGDAMFITRRGR